MDVAAAHCSESDGGIAHYIPGYVTMTSSSGVPTFYYDECHSNTKVKEYYCKDADTKTYDYYTCPYGCQTTNQGVGYCASSAATTTTTAPYWQTTTTAAQQYLYYCTDSDGGDSPYTYGVVTGTTPQAPNWKAEFKDLCAGNVLVEYYCTSSSAYGNIPLGSKQYTCPNGCQNGACVGAQQQTTTTATPSGQCYDSDGLNYYTYGYVKNKYGTYYYDSCSGNIVNEYYCSVNDVAFTQYVCPSGYTCQNGACVYSAATTTTYAPQQTTTTATPVKPTQDCGNFKDCNSCTNNGCNWCGRQAPFDSWSYCTNDCNAFSCFLGKCISNSFEC